jgi:hypothetical protein
MKLNLAFYTAIIINWAAFTYMVVTGDKKIILFICCVLITGGVFLLQHFADEGNLDE